MPLDYLTLAASALIRAQGRANEAAGDAAQAKIQLCELSTTEDFIAARMTRHGAAPDLA